MMLGSRLLTLVAAAALAASAACGKPATGDPSPLVLEATIPLDGVAGRIDHLAIDLKRGRLFVAELGNGTVEAIDLASGRSLHRISGLSEPQGLAYLPGSDELVVASGGDGSVRFYHGADLAPAGVIRLGDDADNVRVDPVTGNVIVGYGSGALAIVDPQRRAVIGTIGLPGHPESFRLAGERAYVNVPSAQRIVVTDLSAKRVLATWSMPHFMNFPMILDPATNRLAVVFRLPARLGMFDAGSGRPTSNLSTCGDADDLFFDSRRQRFYVTCGSGVVDVFGGPPASERRIARVATRRGARTSIFVPERDRLYVAARAGWGNGAAILVYRPHP